MKYPPILELTPRPGYIYLARLVGLYEVKYKIGQTRNLKKRMQLLKVTNGVRVFLIAYGHAADADRYEKIIQETFYDNCIHGEYFTFENGELCNVIETINEYCCNVETDYTFPKCPNDGHEMESKISKEQFKCKTCGYTIPYIKYLTIPERMLPFSCDEMNDDDMLCINDRYDCIFNWNAPKECEA